MYCKTIERYRTLLEKRDILLEQLETITDIQANNCISSVCKTNKVNSFEDFVIKKQQISEQLKHIKYDIAMIELNFILVPTECREVMDLYYIKRVKKADIMRKLALNRTQLTKSLNRIVNALDYEIYY
ncbi:hypothetical protein [uncultured Parvimonas sp.]|uniref:hypothetical protein n=1 Tax=uncultured Parvimonas sp. TaxID=747372 RepID=UPI0025933A19|nr:hypothetical protein [uncultured Parvimonas sp.]